MRRFLWFLRIVIIAGTFAGVMHSRAPQLTSWSLESDSDSVSRTIHLEARSVVRAALTMISLSLL